MAATWPAALPQALLVTGFALALAPNAIEFAPEHGPPMARRRGTAGAETVTGAITVDGAGFGLFEAFWRTELRSGTLPFSWRHPARTSEIVTMRFTGGPPEIAALGAGLWRIAFSLLILP